MTKKIPLSGELLGGDYGCLIEGNPLEMFAALIEQAIQYIGPGRSVHKKV